MKRVLVFGTFDVLHPGHIYFLKQAKRKGDWLIVSVARDAYVRHTKRREPVHLQGERIEKLLETGLVDEAYLSDEDVGNYGIVSKAKPDVVCFGHDQASLQRDFEGWLSERRLAIATHVISAFHPERYKSSIINPTKKRD